MYILGNAARGLMCNTKSIHFRSQQVCGFSGYVILCSESTCGHSRSAAFLPMSSYEVCPFPVRAGLRLFWLCHPMKWSTSCHSRSAAFLANFIHILSAQPLGVNVRTIPQFLVQQMVARSCLLHNQSTYSAVISCQMANLQVKLKPWVYADLVCVQFEKMLYIFGRLAQRYLSEGLAEP